TGACTCASRRTRTSPSRAGPRRRSRTSSSRRSGATWRSARPGRLSGRDGHQLALADGLHDLLLGLLAAVVGLGVAGDAHHPGRDLLVAHDDQAADDVALHPADPLEVEPRQVDPVGLAAPRAALVVDLL